MRRVVTVTIVATAVAAVIGLGALGASALAPHDAPGQAVDVDPVVVVPPASTGANPTDAPSTGAPATPTTSPGPTADPGEPTTVAPMPPDDLDDDDDDDDDDPDDLE